VQGTAVVVVDVVVEVDVLVDVLVDVEVEVVVVSQVPKGVENPVPFIKTTP
jgi:hypothetical protein